MKENVVFRMLPRTKQLLEDDIDKRREELKNISGQGADIWEGDQWHSTTYREQQRMRELAIRYLQMIDSEEGRIEELSEPTQNEHVEVGHMVKVELLDDEDVIEQKVPYSLIHVLTKEDVQYLGKDFDNVTEMVISADSPVGKTLLGLRRGDTKTYVEDRRLHVLDEDDAISTSSLFKK
jgi:transcription elongation GreA/GreB family factor